MTSGESLDAKLARVSSRLSTEREQIRQSVQADQTLAYLADLAWNRTGPNGGLLYIRIGDFTRGRDLPPGIVPAEAFRVNHAQPGPRETRRAGTKAPSSETREDQGYMAGVLPPPSGKRSSLARKPIRTRAAKGVRGWRK